MTVLQFPLSRPSRALKRSSAVLPRSAVVPERTDTPSAWRTPTGKSASGIFFSESEARRLTLGPRLPHHRRHPLTLDEALAGLVLALGLFGSVIYLLARWIA